MSLAIRGHDGEAYDVLPGGQYDLGPVREGQDDLSYASQFFHRNYHHGTGNGAIGRRPPEPGRLRPELRLGREPPQAARGNQRPYSASGVGNSAVRARKFTSKEIRSSESIRYFPCSRPDRMTNCSLISPNSCGVRCWESRL